MAKKSRKSKRKLTPAQRAGLAKGQAMLAAKRAKGTKTKKKRAGTKRAKKITKGVAKQVKASKKEIARDAKRAVRAASKKAAEGRRLQTLAIRRQKKFNPTGLQYGPPTQARVAIAEAAKTVADRCATDLKKQAKAISKKLKSECTRELNKIKTKAEQSFKLAGFGEALGGLSRKGKKPRKSKKGKKTAKAKRAKTKRPASGPTLGGKRAPAPRSAPFMGGRRPIGRPGPAMQGITAEDVLRGVRAKAGKKMVDVWVCAGVKRTGCGSTGHVVAGGKMFPAIRLRPGPKQVLIRP